MATSQGQDIVRCQLCPNPVEHHCNLCHIDLCFQCVPKHLADKSKRHEVVDFFNKKEGLVLPECKYHNKTLCEMYCNDCHEPTCVMCVTTTHKKHDLTDIKSILENLKRCITADVEELEKTFLPRLKEDVISGLCSEEFDKIMKVIQEQEDTICTVVRKIGSRLKDEVTKQKKEVERKNKEVQCSVAKKERELIGVIQNHKSILNSDDATKILTYKSNNQQFEPVCKQYRHSSFVFLGGNVRENQLHEMFGSLQCYSAIKPDKQLGMLKLMKAPVVLSTIQGPFGEKTLYSVLYEKTGKFWVNGDDSKMYQIDQAGCILKTINGETRIVSTTLNENKGVIFSTAWPSTKVYNSDGQGKRAMLHLSNWSPRGVFHSANGYLLVSLRSLDKTQSRVVRYSGTTETMIIQHDSKGNPLFSVDVQNWLFLTENGNADICVADHAAGIVVVFNASGELRFKYHGNIHYRRYTSFTPVHIVSDVNNQILISDLSNDIVHAIDNDGNFLRYIEVSCIGGLSIDTNNRLVAGGSNGKIRVMKYLQ